jgi:hypothetical protein
MKPKTEFTATPLTVIGVDIGKVLLVDNADCGRLLRHVQPNIVRHRNLRRCKPPGNMPGSRHYRCLYQLPLIMIDDCPLAGPD